MAKGMSFKVLMQLQTKEFQKGLKSIEKQLNGFKNFMKSAFALGSITMFGRELINVSKDFESAMARVQSVSNATNAEFKAMQAEAEKLGKTTRYTATEAAGALENLTRNGMSATQATKALSGVLQLAQANSIELAEAANIVTNTLNMFNLGVEQTQRVNDVLSSTASHAATNITELSEAMVNAAPAANVLGFSIEEVSSAIGALAQRGVKGSEAGTKLRIAFQKMADPKVIGKMKEFGIDVDESTMKAEGLRKTIEKIAAANLSLGDLGKVFDAKSAMAIQLMVASLNDLDDLLDATANSAGETARMAKQAVGSVQGELDTLKSMYEGLLISIGQKTSGMVKSVVKLLQNLIGNFETVGGTIMNIASVAVPLLTKRVIALGKSLSVVMKQAAADAATVKAALGSWITLIATLVTWIGTALVGAWNRAHKEIRDANKQMTEANAKISDMQRSVQRLKEKIGDGSDKASLTAALKEAIKLFPEFADAINDAKRIAAATGEWDNLKRLLQDIADLQSLVITREAKQALANAKARKIGNQMYDEGAPLSMNPDYAAAKDIRKQLKQAGFTPDESRDVFYQLADILGKSTKENAWKNVKDFLESYEIKVSDGDLMNWLDKRIDTDSFREEDRRPDEKRSGDVSGLSQTNRDISTIDSTAAVQNYKIWKDHFDQQESELRKKLGDVSKHQKEFNDEMAKYVKELADKTIEGLPQESNEYKELATLLKAYPEPRQTRVSSSGGEGSSSKVKTDTDKIKDAIKDYNEEVTKLNNRLEAGTITTENYESELDNLEDKTWEAITSISKFAEILNKIGKGEFGKDLANKYAANRSNEGAEQLVPIYESLAKYLTLPKPQPKSRYYDKKSKGEQEQEEFDIKLNYAEAIDKFAKDLEEAIENGDYDIVKGDALEVLENLKESAKAAGKEADDLKAKLDLSEAITKLDEQIQTLGQTAMDSFEGFAGSMDRIMSGLWAIAEIFDEDLRDSPMFQAFEAFSSVLNSSIQIMQGVAQAIQMVKVIQTKAAMQKVKDAAISVAADKAESRSAMEKAAAEATAAAAGGASSVASVPIVGPALAVAAAASIAAALLAAFSKFEYGGLVGGNSYSGDKVPAFVNSGEMVLTRGQQASLWKSIQSGNIGGGGAVDFRIRGCDLVGVINNEQSRRRG